MSGNQDILQELSLDDLIKLRDLYKEHLPHRLHTYNFLTLSVKWKQRFPSGKHVTVYSPRGNWQGGTFVALYQCSGYEVYISTLENDCNVLSDIVIHTKQIDWSKRMLVYAVYNEHIPTVKEALKSTPFNFFRDIPCDVWWMPAEDAKELTIECPPQVFLSKLDVSHAATVDAQWPHRFKGSTEYVASVLGMNGGWGLFLKETGELVAWIMRIQMGLGMLHTMEGHTRKGYGHLVTKAAAKQLGQEGTHPMAAVVVTNVAAQATFRKIGFRQSYRVVFIESQEEGCEGKK